MKLKNALSLQWQEYQLNHQNRFNLVLHLLTTPWFMLGSLMLPVSLVVWSVSLFLIGISLMLLVVVLQGFGHAKEKIKPRPFAGVGDFALRILLEQWITFPKYVLSGEWKRQINQ